MVSKNSFMKNDQTILNLIKLATSPWKMRAFSCFTKKVFCPEICSNCVYLLHLAIYVLYIIHDSMEPFIYPLNICTNNWLTLRSSQLSRQLITYQIQRNITSVQCIIFFIQAIFSVCKMQNSKTLLSRGVLPLTHQNDLVLKLKKLVSNSIHIGFTAP